MSLLLRRLVCLDSAPAVSSSSPGACSCVASSVSTPAICTPLSSYVLLSLLIALPALNNCCTAARALNRMTLCSTSRSSSYDSLCSSHSSIIARLSVLLAILVARLSVLHARAPDAPLFVRSCQTRTALCASARAPHRTTALISLCCSSSRSRLHGYLLMMTRALLARRITQGSLHCSSPVLASSLTRPRHSHRKGLPALLARLRLLDSDLASLARIAHGSLHCSPAGLASPLRRSI